MVALDAGDAASLSSLVLLLFVLYNVGLKSLFASLATLHLAARDVGDVASLFSLPKHSYRRGVVGLK